MIEKIKRYNEAIEAGKSKEQAVKAAIPGVDPGSDRFKNWMDTVEDMDGALKAKGRKKSPKPKPVEDAPTLDPVEDDE
jgi:hypothetical protein